MKQKLTGLFSFGMPVFLCFAVINLVAACTDIQTPPSKDEEQKDAVIRFTIKSAAPQDISTRRKLRYSTLNSLITDGA